MLVFFIFAMFLGAALQITNAYGGAFLDDFTRSYPDSFGVKHPNVLLSISQISETLFILTIPFFLQRFGIKKVMLMSILAWVFRFGLFGIGNPGPGLFLLILSMIVYGMAFDFFNISGSLFVEKEADIKIRASAQGLFMMMTNGIGAFLGTLISGKVVDYFTKAYFDLKTLLQELRIDRTNPWLIQQLNGKVVAAGGILDTPIFVRDWQSIWFSFAGYALVLGIVFPLIFKYRHNPQEMENIHH